MDAREQIHIELSAQDRNLILKYGYPFPRIESAIRALDGNSSVETVALDKLEVTRLIGDLWRSIKESDDEPLRDRLDDLCERLEFFQRGGYTVI